jgi:type IV pilus assembly protein PilA
MKFLQKIRKGKKGFTLIELLVVIAILGVIAAVAVPNVVKFIGSGTDEAKSAELHNVTVAVTAAMVGGNGTIVAITDTVITANPGGAANAVGTYLTNNTSYKYTITTAGVITQGAKA